MSTRPDRDFPSRYGRVALVVGGSDGLGAEFARALAGRGLDLVLVARRSAPLSGLAERLRAGYGVEVTPVAMDASVPGAADAIADRVAELDIGLMVCNAAADPVGSFLSRSAPELTRMLDLNCRLATDLGYLIGRWLAARGRGGLIFLSSMAGFTGSARVVPYAATKAYLRVLAEGLWAELRPYGVDVLACCPGRVRTPTFDQGLPRPPGWLAPPVMQPGSVVRQTLAALGQGPVVVPGRWNRLAATAQRLMPRAATIALTSSATESMYPDGHAGQPLP